jgi:hypothetical protein
MFDPTSPASTARLFHRPSAMQRLVGRHRAAPVALLGALLVVGLAGPAARAAGTSAPTPTPTPVTGQSSTNISVGNGGDASASANGGVVVIGSASGDVSVSANGGNASASANGGSNNSVAINTGGTVAARADAWKGGRFDRSGKVEIRTTTRTTTRVVETRTYDRPCVAIYAPEGAAPDAAAQASLNFQLEVVPTKQVALRIVAVDDEFETRTRVAIELNGKRVYEGDSPFANAKPAGGKAGWTRVVFIVPPRMLKEGGNEVTVINLGKTAKTRANVEVQQFIVLAKVSIRVADGPLIARVRAEPAQKDVPVAFMVEDLDDDNGDAEVDDDRGHGNDPSGTDAGNPGKKDQK